MAALVLTLAGVARSSLGEIVAGRERLPRRRSAILGLQHQPGSEPVPDDFAFEQPHTDRTEPDIFGAAVALR